MAMAAIRADERGGGELPVRVSGQGKEKKREKKVGRKDSANVTRPMNGGKATMEKDDSVVVLELRRVGAATLRHEEQRGHVIGHVCGPTILPALHSHTSSAPTLLCTCCTSAGNRGQAPLAETDATFIALETSCPPRLWTTGR